MQLSNKSSAQGMSCDDQAQGTVEYLIIVGVIIVLILFTTAFILYSSDQANQVSSVATKQELENNILGVKDIYADSAGNNLLTIKNNAAQYITVGVVEVGDASFDFGQRLRAGQEKNFIIPSSQVCENGKKILDIKINYTSRYGLEKVRVIEKAQIICQDYSVIDPPSYADANPPIVTWLSPANGYYTNSSEIDINFTVTDFSAISICELLSGGIVVDGTNLPTKNVELTLTADTLLEDTNKTHTLTDINITYTK